MSLAAAVLSLALGGLDLELPEEDRSALRAELQRWAPLLEIAGVRAATLRLAATARGFEGPISLEIAGDAAAPRARARGAAGAVRVGRVRHARHRAPRRRPPPRGPRSPLLGAGAALGKLAGLDPVRHLGWAGDEAFLRFDDFAPPAELVPSLLVGIRAPDGAAATKGLAALAGTLEQLWGVRFVARSDGGLERHETEVPWLIDCQPAWALHDGWAWLAYDGRRLGRPAPGPSAPATGTLYLRLDGRALRSLNAVETAGASAHRESPLEAQLDRFETPLEEAVQLDPRDPSPLIEISKVAAHAGDQGEARRHLGRALALRPGNGTLGLTLATEADEATSGPANLTLVDPDGNQILIDQHVPSPRK